MAVVYIDGKFYNNREEATVSVWDHGFLYGDGVFEGIRVYNGKVFRCEEHLKRLYDSAKAIALQIPIPIEEMEKVMIETIRRSKMTDCYIRLVVSRGVGDLGLDPRKCKKPSIVIIVDTIALFPKEKYDNGVEVVIAATRKNFPEAINPNVKSLNYLNNIMAKVECLHAGVEEALMVNIQGYITEGTADNIFVIKDGKIKTPPASAGILIGMTRNVFIEVAKELGYSIEETNMTSYDLFCADEIFLTGTGAEAIPVVKVNGRAIGNAKPGPIYKHLLDKFHLTTQMEGTSVYTKEEMEDLKVAKV